jgi:ferric-dicitrate binding protein FerR (iron transport regulator)
MFRRKLNTAEGWAIRLSDRAQAARSLSDTEREELTRWLVRDPERLKQVKMARLISQLGGRLTPAAAERIAARSRKVSSPGWTIDLLRLAVRPAMLGGFAVAASCVVLALVFLRAPDPMNRLRNHRQAQTEIGQITSYVLPDNSNITIAASSSVQVDFSSQKRTIHLTRGEVFLDVEHDRDHPFVIAVGDHEVVVTGTKLNINFDRAENAVEVAVLEGKIDVRRHTPADQDSQEMGVGEVILFPDAGPSVRRNLTPEQAAAWRTRQLYFDDAHLSEVLTEVNRYAAKPVIADSPDVGRLTLTGQFNTGDTATLLVSLQKLYGLTAQDRGDSWHVVGGKN